MNIIDLFAKGGKIDSKTIKSEIERIFAISESEANELWQNAVNEYGSEENVVAALYNEIGPDQSDESIQRAMMNVLKYTPVEESVIFKCGGKLQQLVTKFGKGGNVDCGCGGIKLEPGGELPTAFVYAKRPEPKSLEEVGLFKRNNDPVEFYGTDGGEKRIVTPKGEISLIVHPNSKDSIIRVTPVNPNAELMETLPQDGERFARARKWWNYYARKAGYQDGGEITSADKTITIVNPNTPQADTLGRYSYPSTNGKFKLLSNGERTATVWDNTGGFPITRYANKTFIENNPIKGFFYKEAPAGYFENLVERVNNRFDKNGVPLKQEGGELDINNLTRRQARELATQNKGYNGEQFNYAMANIKNALRKDGLRGRELRANARRIVSGAEPMQREALLEKLPSIETNNIDGGFVNNLAGSRPTGSADQLSFNDRFRLARGMGDKTFTWRGKDYNTKLATKPKSIELPETVITGYKPYELSETVITGHKPHELPETVITGHKSPETHIMGYLGTELPETVVTGYRKKPETHILGYLGTELPETVVTANRRQPETHIMGYLGTELPETVITGQRKAPETHYVQYLGNMLPEVNVTAQKQKPESHYTQYLGTMLPEVTVNGYRNIQTPVPMSKCGGKVESAKCGCKTKAECGVKLKPAMKCGGKTKKRK